jgi:cytochrome c551/c552
MVVDKPLRWPVYLAVGLLIIFGLLFVAEFVITTEEETAATQVSSTDEPGVTGTVTALLQNADAQRGATLVQTYGCTACHVKASSVGVAPPFKGLADRAATRRPSLKAAEYIYESIISPDAYIVEDYADAMPNNFAARLSNQDLGDIIAFLLTTHAE